MGPERRPELQAVHPTGRLAGEASAAKSARHPTPDRSRRSRRDASSVRWVCSSAQHGAVFGNLKVKAPFPQKSPFTFSEKKMVGPSKSERPECIKWRTLLGQKTLSEGAVVDPRCESACCLPGGSRHLWDSPESDSPALSALGCRLGWQLDPLTSREGNVYIEFRTCFGCIF